MKILFVHDNAWVCQSLAGALKRKGHVAYVITGDKFSADWSLGADNVFETTNTYRLIPTLTSVLANKDVDLINTNNYTSWVAGEISKKLLNVPHIITLHGTDMRHLIQGRMLAFKRKLLINTLKASNLILATTPDLLTYSYIIGREILHLPQPIDTGIFNDRAPKNELLYGDPIVFSPTRLLEIKGAKNIIEILGKIVENYPSSHIYHVKWGDQEHISMLLNRIPSKNLTLVNKMSRDLMPSWYVSSDIVIGQMTLGILSNIELEAMGCKTPVIVYDRYYGYGYRRRDLKSAWEMIHNILLDHTSRKKLIEKGSRIIKEKHDINLVVELYLKYLKRILHESS